MLRGVIFDMDGVLVASGPAHAASWRLLARRHGRSISDEQFRQTFGLRSADIIRGLWGADVTDDAVRRLDDEKERIYRELISGMVPLTIGARELLSTLVQADYRLAVATSGPPENVALVLREKNLTACFAAVVTGADVRRGKPAPDCFQLAAERLDLPVDACTVVEDAPVGIQAGCRAGMRVVGFVGTHPADALRAAGAAVVVERLADITPTLLRSL